MTKKDFIKSVLIAGLLWSIIALGVLYGSLYLVGPEQEVCSE